MPVWKDKRADIQKDLRWEMPFSFFALKSIASQKKIKKKKKQNKTAMMLETDSKEWLESQIQARVK